MRFKLLTLAVSAAMVLPAMAQSAFIQGSLSNGDLEAADLAPFGGQAGVLSTTQNHTSGGSQSVEIDLTANNGNAQWKGISDAPAFTVASDQEKVTHSVWVYVPAATTFGSPARLNLNLQRSLDNGETWGNINGVTTGPYQSLNLTTVARDTWVLLAKSGIDLPEGTTDIRLNSNIETLALVNGADADGGEDGTGPATPADWEAEGFSGVIYLDDFTLSTAPLAMPPAGTLICDEFENGNFEAGILLPWNPQNGGGDIDSVIVKEGTQSMSVNLSAVGKASNRWRGFQMNGSLPAVNGDVIGTSAWIYIPSTTTFGPAGAFFNAELRSDRNTTGNGNLGGQLRVDLTSLATDEWVNVTALTPVTNGDQSVSAINTTGWNVETANGADQVALGYGGLIYFDDVKLINLGQGSEDPGVLVGPATNNGGMEGTDYPEPWKTTEITPWNVSGAGSVSTTTVHTGTQAVRVDLTANNSNQRWKQLHATLPELDIITPGYTMADISAWVYVPAATTFGATARVNLPIRDGGVAMPGGPSIDLTTVERDMWVEVSATGIDLTAFTTSLAINNWNVETVDMVGTAADVDATDATPQDWIDSGYEGVFYFDDVSVRAYSTGIPTGPISINSIAYDDDADEVTINYNSSFPDGVDVYYSDDNLSTWTADGFGGTGNAVELKRTTADPNRYYILVEPFSTPPANPNP